MYKCTLEHDLRMYCLSECECRIWPSEPSQEHLKPEDQGRPTLSCRRPLFFPSGHKSGQAEVEEGQGQPEQGGERAQNLLKNKEQVEARISVVGVPCWPRRLGIHHCHHCGSGSNPWPGTSACHRGGFKKREWEGEKGSTPVAQWVKDPALLHLWHRFQLQCKFNPWPRNFHMPQGYSPHPPKK